jgi:hypothetical protein
VSSEGQRKKYWNKKRRCQSTSDGETYMVLNSNKRRHDYGRNSTGLMEDKSYDQTNNTLATMSRSANRHRPKSTLITHIQSTFGGNNANLTTNDTSKEGGINKDLENAKIFNPIEEDN